MLKRSVVVVAAMIVALQPAGGASGSLCPSCGLSATGAGSRDRLMVAGGGGMRLNGGGMGGGMTGGGGGMGGGGGGGMGGGGGIAGGGDPMGPGGFGAPRANCPEHRSKLASRHAGPNSPRTDFGVDAMLQQPIAPLPQLPTNFILRAAPQATRLEGCSRAHERPLLLDHPFASLRAGSSTRDASHRGSG